MKYRVFASIEKLLDFKNPDKDKRTLKVFFVKNPAKDQAEFTLTEKDLNKYDVEFENKCIMLIKDKKSKLTWGRN